MHCVEKCLRAGLKIPSLTVVFRLIIFLFVSDYSYFSLNSGKSFYLSILPFLSLRHLCHSWSSSSTPPFPTSFSLSILYLMICSLSLYPSFFSLFTISLSSSSFTSSCFLSPYLLFLSISILYLFRI